MLKLGGVCGWLRRSLQTLLCLQYRPEQVAVAVVDLSLRMLRADMPLLGGRAWWQHCDVTAPQLEGAPCAILISLSSSFTFFLLASLFLPSSFILPSPFPSFFFLHTRMGWHTRGGTGRMRPSGALPVLWALWTRLCADDIRNAVRSITKQRAMP